MQISTINQVSCVFIFADTVNVSGVWQTLKKLWYHIVIRSLDSPSNSVKSSIGQGNTFGPEEVLANSLNVILKAQEENGLYLYSKEKPNIFRSLYHYLIMIVLYQVIVELPERFKRKTVVSLDKAQNYSCELERNDGSIKEPEMNIYTFAPSLARSALAETIANRKTEPKVQLKFFSKFFRMNEFF